MSTRSIVARGEGDGFSGRYIHWNGDPPYQAATLWRMVNGNFKGDVEAALKALVDGGGAWSAIGEEEIWELYAKRHNPMPGEKERWVKGVGIKMKDQDVPKLEWHGEEDAEFMDAQWIYVLTGGEIPTLSVLTGNVPPELIGSWDLRGEEPNWGEVECGETFERCTHIAEFHFKETRGTASAGLGTQQYLGREPLRIDDASGVRYAGEEWKMSGSYRKNGKKVEMYVENAAGRKRWLQVEGPGTPKIELRYPKVLASEEGVEL